MSNWKGKYGPLLIAEIGGNHEGNFDYALRLTRLAIDSGADFVKFQIYTGDTLVNPVENAKRNRHFKKFELTQSQHEQLAKICLDNEVGYMASVWDPDAMSWIDPFLSIYKIGSGDLTAYSVIEKIVATKKPIIISCGLASEKEVMETVEFIRSCDDIYLSPNKLAVLQCTSMYPISENDANLNVMYRLKELLGTEVGYSDHTEGSYALEVAYAMGAQILEFHFTDQKENKSFRDHKVSLTNAEVKTLITRIERINTLMGSRTKEPLAIEGDHVVSFRRALYPVKDIPINSVINKNDLVSLRPNHGIDARDLHSLIGKKTNKNLTKYEKLDWKYFE